MTYTAFVPARSGSKRFPHKNIRHLGDKPLIAWTLEACISSDRVDEVIFSTDSLEYWDIANEYFKSPKLSLDMRQAEDASDTTKIFDYLKTSRSKIFGDRTGAFILALPTVPFRRINHIEEAISLFESTAKPVFSATQYGFPISFSFKVTESGDWKSIFPDSPMKTGNTRSQNQQESYHPNGAIYVRNILDLSNSELNTLYTDAVPYFMSRESSIDIDIEIDFKIASAHL